MKKKVIKIHEEDYMVSFPNVGQMIEIEQLKLALTGGRYVEFAISNLFNHIFILDFADSIAYLSVLIPELQKDLKLKGWGSMDADEAKYLIEVYKEQFLPWFKPMLDDLYDYNKKEQAESNDKDKDGKAKSTEE